jgi:hypothetical protein
MATNLRNAMGSLFSAGALALGLTILGSLSASAQQISPSDRIMVLNVAGAMGRMYASSTPGFPVFVHPPNASQSRLLWSFTPDLLVFTQGGQVQVKSAFKIASVTDPSEILSPYAGNFYSGALVGEMRDDPSVRFAGRWELVRVPNLPFYQLRNAWNSGVCAMNSPYVFHPVVLGNCNPNDSQQWYTIMTSTGFIK